MNEHIDVVHQTAESGLSPGIAMDILWLLVVIYFIIFVFVFIVIKNCMLCTPFILWHVHASLRHCMEYSQK